MLRGAALACVALTLSACGGLQWPPPPQQPSQASNVPRAATAAKSSLSKTHTVVRGDTLYGVAKYYGVNAQELAQLNNLPPPYNIKVNQTLLLPGGGMPSGGSYEVADRSGGPISAPAPRSVAVEKVQIDDVRPAPIAVASIDPSPSQLPSPAVKEIATPAMATNAPSVVVPVSLPASEPEPQPTAPSLPALAAVPATTPIERPVPVAEPVQEKPQLASLPPAESRSTAKPRGTGRFIWPVEGKLMSGYGSKGDGLNNDGINIAAPRGAPVYAAAPGVVAYAGNEIRGFGNLLLIQHPDGWMTAYAHNEKLLVKRGDKVTQGQQIGAVGATGNVMSPQLHFEIRRGKRAVDPLEQLGGQRAS